MDRSYLADVEAGGRNPSLDALVKISKVWASRSQPSWMACSPRFAQSHTRHAQRRGPEGWLHA